MIVNLSESIEIKNKPKTLDIGDKTLCTLTKVEKGGQEWKENILDVTKRNPYELIDKIYKVVNIYDKKDIYFLSAEELKKSSCIGALASINADYDDIVYYFNLQAELCKAILAIDIESCEPDEEIDNRHKEWYFTADELGFVYKTADDSYCTIFDILEYYEPRWFEKDCITLAFPNLVITIHIIPELDLTYYAKLKMLKPDELFPINLGNHAYVSHI